MHVLCCYSLHVVRRWLAFATAHGFSLSTPRVIPALPQLRQLRDLLVRSLAGGILLLAFELLCHGGLGLLLRNAPQLPAADRLDLLARAPEKRPWHPYARWQRRRYRVCRVRRNAPLDENIS